MVNIEEKMIGLTNQSDEIILNNINCPWRQLRQYYIYREANFISHWKEAGFFFVETDWNDITATGSSLSWPRWSTIWPSPYSSKSSFMSEVWATASLFSLLRKRISKWIQINLPWIAIIQFVFLL